MSLPLHNLCLLAAEMLDDAPGGVACWFIRKAGVALDDAQSATDAREMLWQTFAPDVPYVEQHRTRIWGPQGPHCDLPDRSGEAVSLFEARDQRVFALLFMAEMALEP